MNIIRSIRAEFYKIRHTWLPWAYLLLPLSYALLAYFSCKVTGLKFQEPGSNIEGYLELLGGVFPIIIGLITAKAADMEASSGQFQNMLSITTSRKTTMIGKTCSLLLCALFSISLAVGSFHLLYGEALAGLQGNDVIWVYAVVLLFCGCLFPYVFHILISFQFGSGASIGLGFVESLIAFLALTGLGDGIWYYIPCTWMARLSGSLIQMWLYPNQMVFYMEIRKCALFAAPTTLLLLLVLLGWFSRWEGRAAVD